MKRLSACLFTVLATVSHAQPFPADSADWRLLSLPNRPATEFTVINDADQAEPVIRAEAYSAAAAWAHPVSGSAADTPLLSFRWKVHHVLEGTDIARKSGDDFAARVYVMFDLDPATLPFFGRWKLRIARGLYGEAVPAAALCYVWGRDEAVGLVTTNAYTDRIGMLVLRNADDPAGEWHQEQRNIAADYREVFGTEPPPLLGIAVAADSDDTATWARAWFTGLTLEAVAGN